MFSTQVAQTFGTSPTSNPLSPTKCHKRSRSDATGKCQAYGISAVVLVREHELV